MKKKFSLSTWLLFLIPSIVGVVLFMIPLPDGDTMRVPIASFANVLSGWLAPFIQWIALATVAIAAIGSLLSWLALRMIHLHRVYSKSRRFG